VSTPESAPRRAGSSPSAPRAGDPAALVWDLPTRVFHWTFAGAFAIAFLTLGDDRYLDWHVFAGYLALAAVVFRIVWGLVGGPYARFREFAYGWREVRAYLAGLLAGRPPRHLGHNPPGSWAIFALLALGLAITVSGIAVLGSEEVHGPLAGVLPTHLDVPLKWTHSTLAWVMLALLGVHVAGVLVESFVHRESLTLAMITGSKPARGEPSRARYRHTTLGVGMLVWVLAFSGGFFRGHLSAPPDAPYRPFRGPSLAQDETWNSECGDCHLAFHPSLLPARSWQRMLAEQADHFGEDLGLDAETLATLERFAVANAAERGLSEPARKQIRTIPAGEAPLRITATAYWREQHAKIDDRYWRRPDVGSRANCAACHLDAELGTFEDAAMHLPKGTPKTPS